MFASSSAALMPPMPAPMTRAASVTLTNLSSSGSRLRALPTAEATIFFAFSVAPSWS